MAPQAKPKTRAPVQTPARARGWRSWLLALPMFGAMGLGAAWGWECLTDPTLLPLRVVHIEGELHYLELPVLERAVAPAVNGSFFGVDLERVREAAAALAWIERAEARRVWPDQLHLRIDEQVPLALWGSTSLVNRRGQVFTPEDGRRPPGLARLDGPEGSAARVSEEFLSLRPRLLALGLEVSRLRLDARGAWTLELENGPLVHLGSRELAARVERFLRLYPRLVASGAGPMEVVDMRYANGLAIRWRPVEVATGPHRRFGAADGRRA